MRVWGKVVADAPWRPNGAEYDPVAQATVTLRGPTTASASTTRDGGFSFVTLAPGRYTASATAPEGARLAEIGSVEFELADANACAEIRLQALHAGRIAGTLLDEKKVPVRDAFVQLMPADLHDFFSGGWAGSTTDAAGRYEFSNVAAGHYVVGVSLTGEPSGLAPFLPARATTQDGRDIIRFEPGDIVTLSPLVVKHLTEVTIPLALVNSSGSPAGMMNLRLEMLDIPGPFRVTPIRTDSDGTVTLRVWAGQRYRVTAGNVADPQGQLEFVAAGDLSLVMQLRRQ